MKTSFSKSRGQQSSALVLTLLTVVLITVAVLAFFSIVTSTRQVGNNRTHGTLAEEMARTAGDYVTAQFVEEITNSSYSSSYGSGATTLYAPRNNTNAVPARIVNSSLATDTNFFNLIRQSISTADPNASGDSTSGADSHGRSVGISLWNGPVLATGAGFASAPQTPNWIYVDATAGPRVLGDPTKIVGRFAYNVYNVGGLLNINVAGHHSIVEAAMTPGSAYAGQIATTQAAAYLTNFPGVSQADIDMLTSFRNSSTAANAPAYLTMLTNSAVAGYLNPTVNATNADGSTAVYDNEYFNSRQDFLRFARTQTTALTNIAPYVTTFSRAVTAPSWEPTADIGTYKYFSAATTAGQTNRFIPSIVATAPGATTIPHYNDLGVRDDYTVRQGEPLIQHRFSLAKLAWITHTAPPTALAPAIQACFGLKWNDTYQTPAGEVDRRLSDQSDPRWDYVGPTGSAVRSSIETLDQVAGENPQREPNFFELLQAGILSGSVGQVGAHGYSDGSLSGEEPRSDYQLIRIGANIIDQARADNYPTPIEYNDIEFWGIKDLPYINTILPILSWPAGHDGVTTPFPNPPVYFYWAFELWNPHQPSGVGGPTKFRVRVNNAAEYDIVYFPGYRNSSDDIEQSYQSTDCINSPLYFFSDNTSTDVQTSYRETRFIRTASPHLSRLGTVDVMQLKTDMGDSPGPLPFTDTPVTPGVTYNNAQLVSLFTVFILEYLDDGPGGTGTYRPYSTFLGHEENDGVVSWGGSNGYAGGQTAKLMLTTPDPDNPIANSNFSGPFTKADPRTYRFDVTLGGPSYENSYRPSSSSYAAGYYGLPTFMDQAYGASDSQLGRLASNNSKNSLQFYADPDGQVRIADAWYGDQNPYRTDSAENINMSARPIILDHPFTSTAEMGYAFRDVPYKTLDFFSATSGDKGLLDIFSLTDEPPVTAGQVDLNSAQNLVRQSLAEGTISISDKEVGVASIGTPTGNLSAQTLAGDYQNFAFSSDKITPGANLPRTRAQLADFLFGSTAPASNPGSLPAAPAAVSALALKSDRESAVRALDGPVQTRTWNFLIDVVAQTGRFSGGGTTADKFTVEGEKHCWLSIAIDRYTGKIVDQQLEFIDD